MDTVAYYYYHYYYYYYCYYNYYILILSKFFLLLLSPQDVAFCFRVVSSDNKTILKPHVNSCALECLVLNVHARSRLTHERPSI